MNIEQYWTLFWRKSFRGNTNTVDTREVMQYFQVILL